MKKHDTTPKRRRKVWTEERIAKLRELYPYYSNCAIAVMLGCTESAVSAAGFKYCDPKPPETLAKTRIGFPKGHLPINKGRKGCVAPGAEKGWFKKGQKPHNTRADGDISIRPDKSGRKYKYIRVSEGTWKMLHVQVWEQAHGTIPKGKILRFLNGDSTDCRLENLELIDRKEHMKRNSGALNLPDGQVVAYLSGKRKRHLRDDFAQYPELIELKRQQIILQRTIKNTQQNEP